ncbi:MAG: hypothetical protein FWD70_03905 [Desulfuromonadales bacterium]|nr:hypothetical protein [Desulfuromonadales bacterium]
MWNKLTALITGSPYGLQVVAGIIGVLLLLCIGLSVSVKMRGLEIDKLEAQQTALNQMITQQNQAIGLWKQKADEQDKLIKLAQQQALEAANKIQTRIITKTQEVVPADCNQAVLWGVNNAQDFNTYWNHNK